MKQESGDLEAGSENLRRMVNQGDGDSRASAPIEQRKVGCDVAGNKGKRTIALDSEDMASDYSSDVATLDGIMHAVYDVLGGFAGQARNWERFRNLYLQQARLIPIVSTAERRRARLLSPDEYIQRVEPIFAVEDFWEREVSRKTEQFGAVAHVLSTYESARSSDGPAFETGSNSVQLFYDKTRWWIVSVMWNTPRRS